jgi:hypothetical protein
MENITPPGTPAKRALAVLDTPPPAEPVPALRIPKKVRRAIDVMASGECRTITEAAEKVDFARETLSRALAKPHIAEHMRQKVLKALAMGAARAGAVKLELLDSDNGIVCDRASSFVLGLATTPSISLNIDVKAGYIIDISPDPGEIIDQARTIPHEAA